MAFLKRFGFYLIGFSIGIIFLAFFLRKKSDETGVEFCYLPNCRVLKALREQPLMVAEELEQRADTAAVRYLLREGDVDFSGSDPRAEPCGLYQVDGTYKELQLRLTLQRCDSLTRLTAYQEVALAP